METILKNFCKECSKETNHTILFNKKTEREIADFWKWDKKYKVVECRGCETISFRIEVEDWDPYFNEEDGNEIPNINISIYPPVLKGRSELDTYFLPDNITAVYEEAVTAFTNNCFLLAAVGFRAVIEAVCKDQGVTGRDITMKIDNLNANGFLSKKEVDRLHAVRFLGNDSVHEMRVPSEEQLHTSLDIIEHLLRNLYLLSTDELETMIREYKDFSKLVSKSIKRKNIKEEKHLIEILGRSIRRIDQKDLIEFEKELIVNIKNDKYKKLELGSIKKKERNGQEVDVQYYLISSKQ